MELKNPIIVIGNKADPAAPFLDASMVAGWLGNSATLVEQDGFGHLTLAQKSTCTRNIISNFFVNGIHPVGGDAVCPIDPNGPELFPSECIKALDIRNAILDDGSNRKARENKWLTMPQVLFVLSGFLNLLMFCCLVEVELCPCCFLFLIWLLVTTWYLMETRTYAC